jgi:hypothetical protein
VDVAALMISILALVASGGAVFYARRESNAAGAVAEIEKDRRRDERAAQLRERDALEARERASLAAELEVLLDSHGTPAIIVRNLGPHRATDVRFELAEVVGGGDLPTLTGPTSADELKPTRFLNIPYQPAAGVARRFRCRVNWSDGSGSRSETFEVSR